MRVFLILFKCICFCVVIILSSCVDGNPNCRGNSDERLNFINNSSTGVYLVNSLQYPDTNLTNVTSDELRGWGYYEMNTQGNVWHLCSWDSYASKNNSGKLIFFIVEDTLKLGSNTSIISIVDYPVAKRYDVTIEQLDSLGWVLTYP